MKRGISFFILLLTGLLLSQVLWGGIQDDVSKEQELLEGVDVDSIGDHAAGLVSRVRAEIDLSHELQTRLAGAGREDSLVLGLRFAKLRLRLIGEIHELADILVDLEKKHPREQLRAEVEITFEYVTPLLWEYIERRSNQIDVARNRRHSTDVQDRPALEDEIVILTRYIDEAFGISLVHVEKLEKLEMESSEARETLAGILADRAADLSGRIDLALERVEPLRLPEMEELEIIVQRNPGITKQENATKSR